jgi:hypothetical protein
MTSKLWIVVTAGIATAILAGPAFAQGAVTACSSSRVGGRQIGSWAAKFRVPRSAHMIRAIDADYVHYSVRYGPKSSPEWLGFYFGALVGGGSPNDLGNPSITWHSRQLACHEDAVGTDWRGIGADGRRWRHIALFGGLAKYEGISPKAADYFDKIIGTMCCGERQYCMK